MPTAPSQSRSKANDPFEGLPADPSTIVLSDADALPQSATSVSINSSALAILLDGNPDIREKVAELQRRGHQVQAKQANKATLLTEANKLRYQKDPVAYCWEIHGMKLTPDQVETFHSIRDNRYTAVQAHNASGKTTNAGLAANWWFDCWENHIVYITSATWSQALNLTFKVTHVQRQRAGLSGRHIEGWIRDPDPLRASTHYIRALNSESEEGMKGEHLAPILIIIEEATGVPIYVWTAVKALMTSTGCKVLAVGNPTNQATSFGEACASENYRTIVCRGLDHPNIIAELQGKPQPFPQAISLQWLTEQIRDQCTVLENAEDDIVEDGDAFKFYSLEALQEIVEHNEHLEHDQQSIGVTEHTPQCWYIPDAVFQGSVLGIFPTVPDEQVIPLGWLTNLPKLYGGKWPLWEPKRQMPSIGVDIARHGTDRTVIVSQFGGKFISLRIIRQMSTEVVKNAIKEMAEEVSQFLHNNVFDAQGSPAIISPREIPIRIDTTGGLGAGPADALRADRESDEEAIFHGHYGRNGQLKPKAYTVTDVNSQTKAVMFAMFARTRSELWWSTREQVRMKMVDFSNLTPDHRYQLMKELSSPSYKPDGLGRKNVDDKSVTKKALGRSPDLADAANLALYHRLGATFAFSTSGRRGLPEDVVQPKPKPDTSTLIQTDDGIFIALPRDLPRGRFGSRYSHGSKAGSSTY